MGRIALVVTVLFSLLILSAGGWGIWQYTEIMNGLPAGSSLPGQVEPRPGTMLPATKLYDWEHQHVILTLENPAAEGRKYLKLNAEGLVGAETVSSYLVEATIASLDPRFWTESSFSLEGIEDGTHATIAQRLVSEVLLEDEPASLRRNIQERVLAMQMTAQYGRQKVLEWYLNAAQYGYLVYGADAAARVYLGKPATQLTIAEAAMLTGLAESPELDPWSSRDLLRDHQVQIIEAMLENGAITAGEAQAALKETIQLRPQQYAQSLAPDFTNLALLQLSSKISLERIYRGGFEITTTLDYSLQKQAECAARVQLDRLQGSSSQPGSEDSLACGAVSALPALQTDTSSLPISVTANVIVLDAAQGEVLAWVGGSDGQPKPSLPGTPQASTILTPLLYLTGFSRGMSPATLLWDLPGSGSATNSSQALVTYHGPIRLRIAMNNDYGGAAEEVLKQVGIGSVWQTEQKFGISTLPSTSSTENSISGLYTQPVSVLDAVRAYGVLAEEGKMAGQLAGSAGGADNKVGLSPRTILNVLDNYGQVSLDWSNGQVQPIVSEQLAYLVTDVLSDDRDRTVTLGAPDIQNVGLERPAPIKTSLSLDRQEAWAIGYIPHLAVGVWMRGAGELKSEMASGLWHSVMKYAAQQVPDKAFNIPEGISRVEVCDPSGLLPSPICPAKVQEVFLQGSEPTQMDELYQEFSIDRNTGKQATIFTPEDQVVKKTYLAMPPNAIDWAKAVGFPLPPESFDDISLLPPATDNVKIVKPKMFAYVSGKVDFFGNAMGNNFAGYWLEVGQGLNPTQWLYLVDGKPQPVQDGLLGTWDTAGLNGNYIVELWVSEQDMRFERAILQVSVDNSPPQVQITAPLKDAKLTLRKGEPVILQAAVSEDQALQRVEFFLDDELVTTLYEAPFIVLWPPEPGEHTLRVVAYDQAGNRTEAVAQFLVNQ